MKHFEYASNVIYAGDVHVRGCWRSRDCVYLRAQARAALSAS